MKKNSKPKFVFEIFGSEKYWTLNLCLPRQSFESIGYYSRRRDAKRAAFRAARHFGWDPMQFSIKLT